MRKSQRLEVRYVIRQVFVIALMRRAAIGLISQRIERCGFAFWKQEQGGTFEPVVLSDYFLEPWGVSSVGYGDDPAARCPLSSWPVARWRPYDSATRG
jgi:hypothetical protein